MTRTVRVTINGKPHADVRPITVDIASALAVRAFGQGFLAGADPRRARRRTVVDAATHEHWRQGFEAGREAIGVAEQLYGTRLKAANPRGSSQRPPSRRG